MQRWCSDRDYDADYDLECEEHSPSLHERLGAHKNGLLRAGLSTSLHRASQMAVSASSAGSTVRRLCAAVYWLCLAGVCCHATMVVCEAFAIVRANRSNDDDLGSLCRHGAASASAKMRKACLEVAHEHSSPFIVAVMMGTLQILRDQLWYCASAPFRTGVASTLVPFVVCAPWCVHALRWLGLIRPQKPVHEAGQPAARIVVVAAQAPPVRQQSGYGAGAGHTGHPGAVRRRPTTSFASEDEFHCLTFGAEPPSPSISKPHAA